MKPRLVVTLHHTGADIIARGITEDRTIFEHVHFATLTEFKGVALRVLAPTYDVVCVHRPEAGNADPKAQW